MSCSRPSAGADKGNSQHLHFSQQSWGTARLHFGGGGDLLSASQLGEEGEEELPRCCCDV